MYYVVKTAFHGGGLISIHRTERQAEKASKRYISKACACGCVGVISRKQFIDLPYADRAGSPFVLAR